VFIITKVIKILIFKNRFIMFITRRNKKLK